MQEKKQAKDTTLVPIVSCSLLLIALAVLLWSLRLLLPMLLLIQASVRIQGFACRLGPVLGKQASSRPSPPAGKAREKLEKRSTR